MNAALLGDISPDYQHAKDLERFFNGTEREVRAHINDAYPGLKHGTSCVNMQVS